MVRPLVGLPPDLSNRSKDFANFWSEVRYRYSKQNYRAGFLIKNLDHSIITICVFDTYEFFLKKVEIKKSQKLQKW